MSEHTKAADESTAPVPAGGTPGGLAREKVDEQQDAVNPADRPAIERWTEDHTEWVESGTVRVVVRPAENPNGVIVFHDGPDGRVALHVATDPFWLFGWIRAAWLRLHGVRP